MINKQLFTGLLLVLFIVSVQASETGIWEIPYSGKEIIVDGQLNDWKTFSEITFADTAQIYIPIPEIPASLIFPQNFDFSQCIPISANKVSVKAFWNLSYLNLAFFVSDKHLFAHFPNKEKKTCIHNNDGVEIYLDTQFDSERLVLDENDFQFIIDINILNPNRNPKNWV